MTSDTKDHMALVVGMRVKAEMKRAGINDAELARRTGLHPSTIGRLKEGKRFPGPGTRAKVSAALGVSEQELFYKGQSRAEQLAIWLTNMDEDKRESAVAMIAKLTGNPAPPPLDD